MCTNWFTNTEYDDEYVHDYDYSEENHQENNEENNDENYQENNEVIISEDDDFEYQQYLYEIGCIDQLTYTVVTTSIVLNDSCV